MEKLVVINDDSIPQEFPLEQKRVNLGRDQTNDVCLSDKSVSRHHATIVRIFTECFLEDEKSTNGTLLNGRLIHKHILKHGDEVTIGKYKLRFEVAEAPEQEVEDLDRTVVLNPGVDAPQAKPRAEEPALSKASASARIRILNGSEKGEVKQLDRPFYTVGKPGGDLILINRRHTGYFLLKMGGDNPPTVNGEPVQVGGVALKDGDRIQMGRLSLEFLC